MQEMLSIFELLAKIVVHTCIVFEIKIVAHGGNDPKNVVR